MVPKGPNRPTIARRENAKRSSVRHPEDSEPCWSRRRPKADLGDQQCDAKKSKSVADEIVESGDVGVG